MLKKGVPQMPPCYSVIVNIHEAHEYAILAGVVGTDSALYLNICNIGSSILYMRAFLKAIHQIYDNNRV